MEWQNIWCRACMKRQPEENKQMIGLLSRGQAGRTDVALYGHFLVDFP